VSRRGRGQVPGQTCQFVGRLAASGVISVSRHAESGATTTQLHSERVHKPAFPIRTHLKTRRGWSGPSRGNSTVVQKSQPRRGSVLAMWGTTGLWGRWTAPDRLGSEIDGPLVVRRPMVNPLVLDDSVAAVGHGGSAMAVPEDSGARSTAVIQPRSVAFSRLPVGVRCLLKGKYSGASCGKVSDGGLLAGTSMSSGVISPKKFILEKSPS
jgi:hypothetical protein